MAHDLHCPAAPLVRSFFLHDLHALDVLGALLAEFALLVSFLVFPFFLQ